MGQKETDYAAAIGRKFPEQVVIALAKDEKGVPDPIALGWTMIVSGTPPMMAIAVARGHYSVGAIRHSKEFVIAFPSEDMAEDALFYGTHSGRDTEKLKAHPCDPYLRCRAASAASPPSKTSSTDLRIVLAAQDKNPAAARCALAPSESMWTTRSASVSTTRFALCELTMNCWAPLRQSKSGAITSAI